MATSRKITKPLLFKFLLLLCMVSHGQSIAHAQWQPRSYEQKTDPSHAKNRYWKDPNVWVYTPEFAERFAMPTKWATDELKGAQAAAFRIVYNHEQTCGWFGDPEACRKGYRCVMDLYTDHDAGLPWKKGAPPMGVRAIMSDKSARFMSPQKRSDSADWDQVNDRYDRQKDILGISGIGILAGKPMKGKSYSYSRGARMYIYEYVRSVYPELDYISFSFGCLNYERPENFRIRLGNDQQNRQLTSDKTSAYEIQLPYSYMQRMGSYMKENYEGRSIWDNVKKRMNKK